MKSFKPIIIMNIILIVVSFYSISSITDFTYKTNVLMELTCILASVLYLEKGYKKDAAKYYKLYMLLSAAVIIVEYTPFLFEKKPIVPETLDYLIIIMNMIIYGNILLLALAKDLGRKVSYGICIFNVSVYLIFLIVGIADSLNSMQDKILPIISLYVVYFANSLNGFVMTIAKYTDKTNRNTK